MANSFLTGLSARFHKRSLARQQDAEIAILVDRIMLAFAKIKGKPNRAIRAQRMRAHARKIRILKTPASNKEAV